MLIGRGDEGGAKVGGGTEDTQERAEGGRREWNSGLEERYWIDWTEEFGTLRRADL